MSTLPLELGMLQLRKGHFSPALNCCQGPLKTTKLGGPWGMKAAPCHLPPHSLHVRLFLLHILTERWPPTEAWPGISDRRSQLRALGVHAGW